MTIGSLKPRLLPWASTLLPCQVNSPGEEGTCSTGAVDSRERLWREGGGRRQPKIGVSSLLSGETAVLGWEKGGSGLHRDGAEIGEW